MRPRRSSLPRNIPALSLTPRTILERCLRRFNLPRARLTARCDVAILLSLGRRDATRRVASALSLSLSRRRINQREFLHVCFAKTSHAPSTTRRLSFSLSLSGRVAPKTSQRLGSSRRLALSHAPSSFPFLFLPLFPAVHLSFSRSRRRGERNLQHCNPAEQRFTAGRTVDASDAQGHSPSGSRRSRDFVRLVRRRVGATRNRRGTNRERERARKRKGTRRHSRQGRHERRIDESCAAASCRSEKSHVLKLQKLERGPARRGAGK